MYFMPSSITASSFISISISWRGNISVASIIIMPAVTHTRSAIAMTFLMASTSRRPQYWAFSTSIPSAAPFTIICSRNCIWLTCATPASAFSLKRPSIILSASDTLVVIMFWSEMNNRSLKNRA